MLWPSSRFDHRHANLHPILIQAQAVRALARRPTAIVSSTLTKTVLVANYFFRIRCEAALALVHVSCIRIPAIKTDALVVCSPET